MRWKSDVKHVRSQKVTSMHLFPVSYEGCAPPRQGCKLRKRKMWGNEKQEIKHRIAVKGNLEFMWREGPAWQVSFKYRGQPGQIKRGTYVERLNRIWEITDCPQRRFRELAVSY